MSKVHICPPIVQVGVIGDPRVSDGRLIPYLTLDCTRHPEVERLIELHGDSELPGDVICTWGWRRFNKAAVYLKLEFTRPAAATMHLCFVLKENAHTVDWIIGVRGLYLQSSKYGTYASEGYGAPSILVEVPHIATFPIWERLYDKHLVKEFRSRGLASEHICGAIKDYKRSAREMWFRSRRSS